MLEGFRIIGKIIEIGIDKDAEDCLNRSKIFIHLFCRQIWQLT
jgi:hypothetical protein